MAPNENSTSAAVQNGYHKRTSRIFPETDEDDIVVSGISGRFPNSRSISEYEYNLYNKIDMVDGEETRWKSFNPEIPQRGGKIYDLEKFDATFFGVHFKQAHTLDPQCRILMEVAYEAILDAGVNPKSLRGTRTGVYVGGCISESEKTWFYEKISTGGFGITGCSRAMLANRISYVLGLNGPSYVVDTACSSSMYALDNAFSAFRNGEIDAAIIGGVNLTLHPYVTLQFARLGVLAADGYCRPFDQDASGYTRSESVNCLFLQRKRDAKRIYGSLVYSKTNCDGFKTEGITYPSGIVQEKLLREFYNEIGISPDKLGYLEAHSTGTLVGDPEECRAIDTVLCKSRSKPLLVGSVKSNIGHSEAASGICSMVKAILALEKGEIAPNINFKSVRKEIPSLLEGRLKVVSEIEKLTTPYIGVNSFGFGGANAHALLKGCEKEKQNQGAPEDDLPRLVYWSSRTEEGVNVMLDSIESNPLDTEYLALTYNIQKEGIPGFVFRGYGLYSHVKGGNATCISKEVQHYTGVQRPIVWVFSGMGSQWTEMGSSLMNIPMFRESINRCHNALAPKGLNLINIITSSDPKMFDNILNSFVGIAAIQIAIVDILRALDFEPDYLIGHSVGELGCAYADGGFTAEQMILSAYSRGKVSLEVDKIKGSMAAVGLGYKNIIKLLPPSIEVACHNSADSSTISGPAEDVEKFVAELKSKNIFAKEVPCSNIAYHSRYIAHMGPLLLKYLQEIIPNPKKRSQKWISSSVPKHQWDQPRSEYSSAEYHTNNLLNSVLFEEAAMLLPPNALTVEIAPHGLLQAILKKSMPNAVNIGLTQRGNKNNANFFLSALGKIHLNGFTLPVERLYPKVEFPVSRGTKTISSLIRWDHGENWFVSKFENIRSEKTGERVFQIGLNAEDTEFLAGHIIDGKVLLPATFYLSMVWEAFSLMHAGPMYMNMPVEFNDIRFVRATHLNKGSNVTLTVSIHHGTGLFDITEAGAIVVTGRINEIMNPQPPEPLPPCPSNDCTMLETQDIYKELRLRGYHYAGAFKSVMQARSDGVTGKVKWSFNWVAFMDCLLQIHILGSDSRSLILPTRIRQLRIFGLHHINLAAQMDPENKYFDVQIDHTTQRLVSGGIEISGLHASPVSRRKPPGIPVLETYKFIPHLPAPTTEISDAVRICVQTALENNPVPKMKIVEVDQDKVPPTIPYFQEALEDLPVVTGDFMLLTSQELELPDIHVEDGKLSTQTNCTFVISTNLLGRPEWVQKAQKSIGDGGYLVSIETLPINYAQVKAPIGFNIIAFLPTEKGSVVLMRRHPKKVTNITVIHVVQSDMNYTWIEKIKNALAINPVILVAQNENLNGLIGLTNCLRKEPSGHQITCVFIDDPQAPEFDLEHPFYADKLKFGLGINVFKNGQWGTYRHLLLKPFLEPKKNKRQLYVDQLQRGDLSSLTWFEGRKSVEDCQIKVVYASLNFRDIMLATGRITLESHQSSRLENQCLLGFEFAGVGKDGKRYMGLKSNRGLATHIDETQILWNVPDDWTLEQAATIPCVYITVYMAFFLVSDIRKGKSILIHAGTGGVGQAAITVALAHGLEVFTTVSTKEKKQFLLQKFPKLKESNIGNSRDTSFEYMVLRQTKGKGVDFVLNSLAEDKLLASVRCLGNKGHFFEIGKFDIMNDSKLGLAVFEKEISFHSIFADRLFFAGMNVIKDVMELIYKGIREGVIKPLPVTVFKADQVEQAFRHMAAGKHIGKVLIQVHAENDKEHNTIVPISPLPQTYFDRNMVYIIPGGLGGFGLELADWMILRGARKLVLSSSKGFSKPYQPYRVKVWKSYGARVEIRTDDITTYEGCLSLIKESMKMGAIGGIFNLAVALRDAIFLNQTPEKFQECLAPKAVATKYLDEISRKLCPRLKYFVVFSSVSCGRGNAGQTNYGMANSIMERIIEQRALKGLPAKAIQWGAVGEVGLVADMAEDKIDMEIGGTLQQRISSCLQELDNLLSTNDAIVSSMVVAEKRRIKSGNIMETVLSIMSIRDLKSVSMGTSLSETGMDSLMAVEIKQTLEREFELFLTPQDLRTMTFQRLQEISDAKLKDEGEQVKLRLARDDKPVGMALLLRNLGDELNSHHTILPLITKNSNLVDLNSSLIIPGLEGVAGQAWYNVGLGLYSPSYILQLMGTVHLSSIQEITASVFEKASQVFKRNQPFYLVGYSFGTFITLELAYMLEQLGFQGYVTIIDGSPLFLKKLSLRTFKESSSDDEIQSMLLTTTLMQIFPGEFDEDTTAKFLALPDWNSRIEKYLEYAEKQTVYSRDYAECIMRAMFDRIKMVNDLSLNDVKRIQSSITLVRPTDVSVPDIDEDYELCKYTTGKVTVKFIEGDHTSMLDNPKLPQIINSFDPNLESDKCFEDLL